MLINSRNSTLKADFVKKKLYYFISLRNKYTYLIPTTFFPLAFDMSQIFVFHNSLGRSGGHGSNLGK